MEGEQPKQNVVDVDSKEVNLNKIDDFSETTNFLSQEDLKEKKVMITNVLKDDENLKNGFEDFLKKSSPRQKLKIKKDFKVCQTEDEIKAIMVENLPGLYKIGGDFKQEETAVGGLENNGGGLLEEVKEKSENEGQAETDKQQAETDKQQAETDKQQAETDKQQAEQKENQAEMFKVMNNALEARDKLIKNPKYNELDAKTNEKSERYNNVKQQLEKNGVIGQLKDNLNTQITEENKEKKAEIVNKFVNDYILLRATADELKSNPSVYEESDISAFNKVVKNLENNCKIPDTSLEDFDNIKQVRSEMFHEDEGVGNGDLKKVKQSNIEKHDYSGVFSETLDEGLVLKTKELIEELSILSQIKGMYMCLGKGENFSLNKAREIKNEDGLLTLEGHVDGVNFYLRHDTTKENSPLQTSTKLAKQPDESFNVGGDNFVNSKFILPSQDQIFSIIKETVKSSPSVDKFDNQEAYLQNLQENIMGKMDNVYENTKFANHYMKQQVKGEKIINKTISFVEKLKESKLDSTINNSNPELYNFINTMDFNIKNSTDVEKNKLNGFIDEIDGLTSLSKNNPNDGNLNNKFSQYLSHSVLLNTKNKLSGDPVEGKTFTFDLFKSYESSSDGRSNGELNMFNFDQMLIDLSTAKRQQKEEKLNAEDQARLGELNNEIENAFA